MKKKIEKNEKKLKKMEKNGKMYNESSVYTRKGDCPEMKKTVGYFTIRRKRLFFFFTK